LSAALFGLFASHTGPSIFGQHNANLFQSASLTYLAPTVFSSVFTRQPYLAYTRQLQFKIMKQNIQKGFTLIELMIIIEIIDILAAILLPAHTEPP
jgi:hypothetical protein